MKLIVGLDVSSTELDVCFLTNDDQLPVLKQVCFNNDKLGANQIKELILKYVEELNIQQIVIGMEATSLYSFHPAMFFHQDQTLNQLNTSVFVEQPNKIKKYREVFEESKDDQLDAFYIADYFRVNRYGFAILKEEQYIALQHLTRTRFQLVEDLVRTKQHFIENIYYKCNTLSKELKQDNQHHSVLSATIIELMTTQYTLDDLNALSLEDLGALVNQLGRGRFNDPEKIAKSISKAIRGSYRLSKTHQESVDCVLSILVRQIRGIEKSIKEIDKAIEEIVDTLPEYQCLTSIPGIGKVYAGGIIAEIGQIERFVNQAQIAKFAGLYWPHKQSGKMMSENTHLAKRGNRYLRYYLVEAANSVRRYDPDYKVYYQKKYNETPKHKHKRAIVLTARKLVRLVDVLLRNHQLYTPQKERIE
ncbi:IS110 family transposase [Globicatella sanguinis]